MYLFLILLVVGFALNIASAFTTVLERMFGVQGGRVASAILRNFLGIPLWAIGLILSFGEDAPPLFAGGIWNVMAGWILIIAGMILIFSAIFSIQTRAVAPAATDRLAEKGIYAVIRHPVYAGVFLELLGLLLLNPTLVFGLAALIGAGWVFLQARVEEIDLLARMPQYRAYMERVPGFLPRLKR